MAIYQVKAPNGQLMKFEGPEGASEEQLLQTAAQQYYSDISNITPQYTTGETISKAFSRGTKRLGSTFGDVIPAMVGAGLGFDDYAKRQMEEARGTEEYIQRNLAPQYPSFKDVAGLGDAGKFVAETIFEQIPNFGTMFLSGGAGSQVAKIGAQEFAKRYTGKKFAEEMAKRQVRGLSAGTALGSYALNAPEVFQNIYDQTGELATGTALLFGAGAAALDSALPASILKNLTPYEKLAISKQILKKSGADSRLVNKIFKGLGKGAVTEGLTEGAQEAISISAEKFVGNNPQIFDSEDFDRIMESSVRGMIAGGGISAITAPFERTETQAPPVPITEKKKEKVPFSDQRDLIPQDTSGTPPVATPTETTPPVATPTETTPPVATPPVATPTVTTPTGQIGLPGIEEIPEGEKDLESVNVPSKDEKTGEYKLERKTQPKKVVSKKGQLEELLATDKRIQYDPNTDTAFIAHYDPKTQKPTAILKKWKWNPDSEVWIDRERKIFWAPSKILPGAKEGAPQRKAVPAAQDTLPTYFPTPSGIGEVLGEPIIKGTRDIASVPQSTAEAKKYEYNETNNTAYDPKTKKYYEWDADNLKWQESKNVNQTKSGTDTTLGIDSSISEQSLTTDAEGTQQSVDRGMGKPSSTIRNAKRGKTTSDTTVIEPSSLEIDPIEITPTLESKAPRYTSAKQFIQELYAEFGQKLIDQFMKRGKLIVVDTASDVAEYGVNPNDVGPGTKGFFIWNPSTLDKTRFFNQKRSGRSFIVADRNNQGTARNLILHEVGEHYGLETMLGDLYAPTMLQLERLRKTDPLVKKAWESVTQRYRSYGLEYGTKTAMTFLSEVAAMIGETAPENTWFRRVMGAVKQFLRRIGFYDPNKITSKDIQEMILYSLNRSLREPSKLIIPPGAGEYAIKNSIADKIFSKKQPFGGYNPSIGNKLFTMAQTAIEEAPAFSKDIKKKAIRFIGELPVGLKELVMGLGGLPVLDQLYGKWLPSIRELMKAIEKRAGAADRQRAIADELAHIGLDIVKNKKRKKIKLIDKRSGKEVSLTDLYDNEYTTGSDLELVTIDGTEETSTHTNKAIENFHRIVYDLSRGEANSIYELGINPTFKEHQDHPLVRQFKTLSKELQTLALGYVAYYNAQARKYNDAIIKALPGDSRTAAQKKQALKDKLIENQLVFYVPFKRRGSYVIRYTSPGGTQGQDYTSERFLTKAERDERIAVLQSPGYNVADISTDFDPDVSPGRTPATTSFFNEVLNELRSKMEKNADGEIKNASDQAMLDNVYGIYLDMFPSADVIQMMRKRKGIYGEMQDLVNGFADTSAKLANHIVNLEYRPQFDEHFANINSEKTRAINETLPQDSTLDPTELDQLEQSLTYAANDITKKGAPFIYNPVADPISANLGYISFWSTIAGNVSSALVNLTQMAIVVYPMLIGKYGFAKGTKAFSEAFKIYMNGGFDKNRRFMPDKSFGMMNGYERSQENANKGFIKQEDVLPADLFELYNYGVDNSVFKRGLGYELTELREKSSADYTGIRTKVDAMLGWMFQNSERANREITFIASYLAEKDTNPNKSFESIAQVAQDLTRESHGTSLPDVGPRYFQTKFGKVMFTFKRFAHSMMALTLRLFHDTTKAGDVRRDELARLIATTNDPQKIAEYKAEMDSLKLAKSIARKQLAGIYGMSFVFAGMQGMPFYGAAEYMAEALYAMFADDDDEPFDFRESTRNVFGDIGYKGPLNKLLNLDLASRTGFANLIWRDDPKRIQEIGMLGYTFETLLGPSYSYASNIMRGASDMSEGQVYRGLEKMMPAFMRNPLKSFRYMSEGARTTNGAKLTDLNGLDAFMQIFGFTNEDLAKAYEQNNAMKTAERNMLHRRSGLLTAAFVAQENEDYELYQEVLNKIDKYNQSTTGSLNPITSKTLRASFKQRERAIDESVNGITLTKKYREYLQSQFNN